MSRIQLLLSCLVSLSLGVVACQDDGPAEAEDTGLSTDATDVAADAEDASSDAGTQRLTRTEAPTGVDPNGHADVEASLSAGQVRAGKITGAQTGFLGVWAHCRTGDFKLYNADIEVCIQAESTNRFEVFSGGMLVDAKRAGQDGDDVIDSVMPLVGLGTQRAESVEVVRDGSQGGPAVIRVEGTDVPIAHLVGVLGGQLGQRPGVDITTEYRLAPDSDTVEIVTWFANPNDGGRFFQFGDWFSWGDRGRLWTPGRGVGAPTGSYGWLASLTADRSYGWIIEHPKAEELGLSAQGLPWAGSKVTSAELEAGDQTAWRRWFVVGDGTLASIRQRAAELRDEPIEASRRTLEIFDGSSPAADRRVRVYRGGDPVSWGVSDENGQVEMLLAGGEHRVVVQGWHGGSSVEKQVTIDQDTHRIDIAPAGQLSLETTLASEGSVAPAQVFITGGGRFERSFDGTLDVPFAPGSYRVVAYRGPEYDAAEADIEITAGQQTDQSLALERSVDTAGWIAGDFHQHMEPSLDSTATVEGRALENAALGVEFFATTDHEAVTDLAPVITQLGLDAFTTTIAGVEISPIETHVGLYPMRYQPDLRGRGTLPLAVLDGQEPQRRLIPELVELARQEPQDPVVQLNHARRNTSGMLELVGFDPEVGPHVIDDVRFTLDFDTMEVINRFDNACRLFADWSGLLNGGRRLTGLGNSDTHSLSGEVGVPRNYMHIDKPAADVSVDDVRTALRQGRVTVGAHAFIDFEDGTVPGDTVSATAGAETTFQVRVQTPNWSEIDTLVAVVNGEVVAQFDSTTEAADHLDFQQDVPIVVDEDAWVVFFAHGPAPSGPVPTGKPAVAFTNPVYLDVDGDANTDGDPWEAPGTGALSLDAVDAFCN